MRNILERIIEFHDFMTPNNIIHLGERLIESWIYAWCQASLLPDHEGANSALQCMELAATTFAQGSQAALLTVGKPDMMSLLIQGNTMHKTPPPRCSCLKCLI